MLLEGRKPGHQILQREGAQLLGEALDADKGGDCENRGHDEQDDREDGQEFHFGRGRYATQGLKHSYMAATTANPIAYLGPFGRLPESHELEPFCA